MITFDSSPKRDNAALQQFTPPASNGRFLSPISAATTREQDRERMSNQVETLLFGRLPWWKRGMDILGASVGIILTAPFMLLVALAIKLTSAGVVIFKQARIGYRGRPFTMYKFRSMTAGCSEARHAEYLKEFFNGTAARNSDGVFKLKDDPRVTPLGSFLRKWSLDELPQLFNVLTGDMSLVGPRPDPCYAAAHYVNWHHQRTLVAKPGITGLWQVEGRCQVTGDEMIRMDIRYGRSMSFITDLKLILRTFKAVLSHAGAY